MVRIQYLDYKKVEKKLLELMKNPKSLKQLVSIYILYIQLKNGTRISESIEAYYKFVETSKREVEVRVRKKRKEQYRLVIIPKIIKAINVKVSERYVRYVCNKYLNTNTHSLRYAYITYLSKMNIPYQIISKITKHSKIEMIEHYTHELLAQELQRKLAR